MMGSCAGISTVNPHTLYMGTHSGSLQGWPGAANHVGELRYTLSSLQGGVPTVRWMCNAKTQCRGGIRRLTHTAGAGVR
jgi:hypothetical protein